MIKGKAEIKKSVEKGKETLRRQKKKEKAAALNSATIDDDQRKILSQLYAKELDDRMGLLHNRFVAYIAESKLPLVQALFVLEIVKDTLIRQGRETYLGEK
jgi:hypothetical protein